MQRLGKHVPAEANTHLTIGLLLQRDVLYVVRAEMLWVGQFEATSQWVDSSALEAVKIEPDRVKLRNFTIRSRCQGTAGEDKKKRMEKA
jgi:hypothetical protein